MAFFDKTWYINSVGYTSVNAWASSAAITAGAVRRQNTAPAVGSERTFVAIVGGTTSTTELAWVVTRGAKNTDSTVTWQECTGASAVNGDLTNTPSWTSVKNQAITLGQIIKRNNAVSYQICSTAGTTGNGSEPAFSDTAGSTTADSTTTWTCIGPVGNFSGGANPHARLANALAANWAAAGNTLYVGDNHAETQATAITLTGPSTPTSPVNVVCNNHLGSFPPASGDVTSGATITASGSVALTISSSFQYHYGITFIAGSAANSGTISIGISSGQTTNIFENCGFSSAGTGTSGAIQTNPNGGTDSYVDFRNCTFKFAATAHVFSFGQFGMAFFRGCSMAAGTTVPTTLFDTNGNVTSGAWALLEGCDWSTINTTLFAATMRGGVFVFKDCKLNASVTVAAAASLSACSPNIDLIRCDSGATNYTAARYKYVGSEVTETTITRTGGASDGTQAQSRKIVTNSTATWAMPFESMPLSIWNNTTGASVTVTVFGVWGGGAVPNNDDIWISVEYLGSNATPVGSFSNATKANILATGTALSSDSSVWGGSTTPFKMTTTITPQMKGPITVYVKAAKASTTFYIDPLPVLS